MDLKKEKPFFFKTSGRAVRIWGGESISNPNIAILEMIKNSWDADATKVELFFEGIRNGDGKLIIKDDGSGMTVHEFENSWMVAATDDKEVSPFTKGFNRQKLGSKGIARFALENLSKHTIVTSYPKDVPRGFRILFDWKKYEKPSSLFEKVENDSESFEKNVKDHGLEIILEPLKEGWNLEKLLKLKIDIESNIPPVAGPAKFSVDMICKEFPQVDSISLENRFLKFATYRVSSELKRDGTVTHKFWIGKEVFASSKGKKPKYTCGPLKFNYYFFYRGPSQYEIHKFDKPFQDDLNDFLGEWGGIKIYRDFFRVKPYGDPENDWLELDKLRVPEPSLCPGNDQVFGYITVSRKDNPELKDTTTREGLITNDAFKHLIEFCLESLGFFKVSRKSLEGKRKSEKVKRKISEIKVIKKIPKVSIVPPRPKILLDFRNRYPEGFYSKLESEVNRAYTYGLPNATLLLARKMVENLLYNVLRKKFGTKREEIWWDEKNKRPLGLGPMVGSLKNCKKDFKHDEVSVDKFLKLVGPFISEANKKAHYIMEYLDHVEQLDKFKIDDMIDLLLRIREHLK